MKKLFWIGALGYGLIEILWRGYTHISMLLAGGICLCKMKGLINRFRRRPLWRLALKSAVMITKVEFLFGVIFNKILKRGVWDYSDRRGNIAGQVCPLYSVLWFLLSLPVLAVLRKKDL